MCLTLCRQYYVILSGGTAQNISCKGLKGYKRCRASPELRSLPFSSPSLGTNKLGWDWITHDLPSCLEVTHKADCCESPNFHFKILEFKIFAVRPFVKNKNECSEIFFESIYHVLYTGIIASTRNIWHHPTLLAATAAHCQTSAWWSTHFVIIGTGFYF